MPPCSLPTGRRRGVAPKPSGWTAAGAGGRYFKLLWAKRAHPAIAKFAGRLEKKKGAKKLVNGILAAKLARVAYFMLLHKTAFDPQRIVQGA